jgi:hypothetical protein
LDDVAVPAFDQAGADGQVEREGAGVFELLGAIAQIAQVTKGGAHGGLIVQTVGRLLARAQGREPLQPRDDVEQAARRAGAIP